MPGTTKSALRLLGERLAPLGFKHHRGDVLTRVAAPEVLDWIAFNPARRSGIVDVNVVVGVRHQTVERLFAELTSSEFELLTPATASVNTGHLSPAGRYQTFAFDGVAATDDASAIEAVEAVTTYGLPFMEKYRQLTALIDLFRNGKLVMQESVHWRLPPALLLAGDAAGATQYVDERVAAIAARTDANAELYRKFAAAVRAKAQAGR